MMLSPLKKRRKISPAICELWTEQTFRPPPHPLEWAVMCQHSRGANPPGEDLQKYWITNAKFAIKIIRLFPRQTEGSWMLISCSLVWYMHTERWAKTNLCPPLSSVFTWKQQASEFLSFLYRNFLTQYSDYNAPQLFQVHFSHYLFIFCLLPDYYLICGILCTYTALIFTMQMLRHTQVLNLT